MKKKKPTGLSPVGFLLKAPLFELVLFGDIFVVDFGQLFLEVCWADIGLFAEGFKG